MGCWGKAWKEKFLHTKSRFGFTGVFTNFTEPRRKRPLGSTTALRMKILARFGDVLSPILLGKFRRLSGKATTDDDKSKDDDDEWAERGEVSGWVGGRETV